MTEGFWTPEREETLRRLVAEGLTYAAIGERWGVSKNVPLSKANRLGLVHPKSPLLNAAPVAEPRNPLPEFPPRGHCLYPTAKDRPHTFCGKPVTTVGHPYCPAHMAKCYIVPPRPQ